MKRPQKLAVMLVPTPPYEICGLEDYPGNYFDSVLALDLKTGAVNWVNTVLPFDVWQDSSPLTPASAAV